MKSGVLYINELEIPVLIASSFEEQKMGLMHIEPPFPAMVFPYKQAQVNKFWMNNVKAPLDIIFCHAGRVANICRGQAYSTDLIGPDFPTDLIIELPEGSAEDFELSPGAQIRLLVEE